MFYFFGMVEIMRIEESLRSSNMYNLVNFFIEEGELYVRIGRLDLLFWFFFDVFWIGIVFKECIFLLVEVCLEF